MKKFMTLALMLLFVSPTTSVALADPCYGCRTATPTTTTTPTTPTTTTTSATTDAATSTP